MAKKRVTRPAPASDARNAIQKAVEFQAAASAALDAEQWNAAGLGAIHAGIAAADAASIAAAGVRNASKDHSGAVEVLDDEVVEFGTSQRRQLAGLLKMKYAVAYDQRLLGRVEARKLVDHGERFVAWARQVVERHVQ
ncbi:MAG: hypothetical protein Q8K99_10665 [Actinomycetota bacterium]|nr:hypothetical protein [Actinomycetota bacterium]